MSAASVSQSRVYCPDAYPQPFVTLLGFCCFCPRPARRGSLYCDRCASAFWEELQALAQHEGPPPTLPEIRALVHSRRAERRRHVISSAILAQEITMPYAMVIDRRLAGSRLPLRIWATLAALGADAQPILVDRRAIAGACHCNVQMVNRAIALLISRGYLAEEWRDGRRWLRTQRKGEEA